jgi:hypothetical protein
VALTWEQLVAHVRRHHVLVVEQPRHLAIGWKIRNVVQLEQIERVTALGAPAVRIVSAAGPAATLDAARVLEHNLRMPVGSVALHGQAYVVRHVVPLAGLTPERLDEVLEVVAHEAARIRWRDGVFLGKMQ